MSKTLSETVRSLILAYKKQGGFFPKGDVNRQEWEIMDPEKIWRNNPDLADWLDEKYNGFRSGDLNVIFCNYLLE